MKKIISLIFIVLLVSCGSKRGGGVVSNAPRAEYAKWFTINYKDGYRVVEVVNPWDTTKILQRYILVDKDKALPDSLPDGLLVRTPVKRIVASSSIDVAIVEKLGVLGSVVGCSEAKYITNASVVKRVTEGKIVDLGSVNKMAVEKLVVLKPDLIFAAPFNGEDYGVLGKAGIPIAEVASYMEYTPLGRCEWIKFYAEFLGKQQRADSIFTVVKDSYKNILKKVDTITSKPKLLVEKRYGQVWYVPCGGSYAVNLYNDAGAFYPWKDSEGAGSLSLSFEEVYSKAHDADIWLFRYFNTECDMTYDMLKAEYPQYASFAAFKNKRIFACNTAKVDYYGTISLQPEMELRDIVKILHPSLFVDVPMVYYKNLSENEK
ncbi:MAG: ABC transporter substrate-binding protein [Rikenellaceae bacterium]